MSKALTELKELTKDQPHNPLRPQQVEGYQTEIRRLTKLRDSLDMDGKPAPWLGAPTADAAKRIRAIHQTLTDQAPKKITGPRANQVFQKIEEVLAADIKPAMLSKTVMRRNPAGAVGHFLRSENSRGVKDAILTVKRAIRGLDPENPDPDLTNMERFRPEGARADGTTSFMPDATIPGFMAMTPLAKENWPLGEPTVDTALAQAQRSHRPPGRPAGSKNREKRPASPAQLAALQRANAAKAAKRHQAREGLPPAQGNGSAEKE